MKKTLFVSSLLLTGAAVFTIVTNIPKQDPPFITNVTPMVQQSGHVVKIEGEHFIPPLKVFFADENIAVDQIATEANELDFIAWNKVIYFTQPYNKPVGNYRVRVSANGQLSNYRSVVINSTKDAPTPQIEGHSISYHVGAAVPNNYNQMKLVIFGRGFDTDTKVLIDGVPFDGLVRGVKNALPDIASEHWNRVMEVRLHDEDMLELGSEHEIRIENVATGLSSESITITVPWRVLHVEIDRSQYLKWHAHDPPDPEFRWENYVKNIPWIRKVYYDPIHDRINTLERSYTEAGVIIVPHLDETIELADADLTWRCRTDGPNMDANFWCCDQTYATGCTEKLTDGETIDLLNNTSNSIRKDEVGYVHVLLVNRGEHVFISEEGEVQGNPTATPLGMMINYQKRNQLVFYHGELLKRLEMYTTPEAEAVANNSTVEIERNNSRIDDLCDPNEVYTKEYFNIIAHEIGHTLNLTHCESDVEWIEYNPFTLLGQALRAQDIFYPPNNPNNYDNGTTLMAPIEMWEPDENNLIDTCPTFRFSQQSRDHISNHPINEVMPNGLNFMSLNSPDRIEPVCNI